MTSREEIDEFLRARYGIRKKNTITSESFGEPSPETIERMKAEAEQETRRQEENWKREAALDSKRHAEVIFPYWRCPRCNTNQAAKPSGHYHYAGEDLWISELPCQRCGSIYYTVSLSMDFNLHRFPLDPKVFSRAKIEKELSKIEHKGRWKLW